jgi:hypothetical protein
MLYWQQVGVIAATNKKRKNLKFMFPSTHEKVTITLPPDCTKFFRRRKPRRHQVIHGGMTPKRESLFDKIRKNQASTQETSKL